MRCLSPLYSINGTNADNVSGAVPASVPFSITLNGDAQAVSMNDSRVNFTYEHEPCSRRTVLHTLSGTLQSSFDGGFNEERMCEWLLQPQQPGGEGGGGERREGGDAGKEDGGGGGDDDGATAALSVAMTFTVLQLDPTADTLRVFDGPTADHPLLLELPSETALPDRCRGGDGECTLSVAATAASALVSLRHMRRAGGHSRMSAVYMATVRQVGGVQQSAVPGMTAVSSPAVHTAQEWEAEPLTGAALWKERGGADTSLTPAITAYRWVGDGFNGWYEGQGGRRRE